MTEAVKYIDSLDIARDDFSEIFYYYDPEDKEKLLSYQQKAYERARALVAQDEFVGRTFPNLDHIGEMIGRPITLTRR